MDCSSVEEDDPTNETTIVEMECSGIKNEDVTNEEDKHNPQPREKYQLETYKNVN